MADKKNIVNIRGKQYKTAAGRIEDFRADHPDWALRSEMIAMDNENYVFKVTVVNEAGIVLSAAHGSAPRHAPPDEKGKYPTWVDREAEKAETAALARALAWLGYGEIEDDSDYVADTPKEQRQSPAPQPGEATTGNRPIVRTVEPRQPSATPADLYAHLVALADKSTVDDGNVTKARRDHMFGEWNKYSKDESLLGIICKSAFKVASRADMNNKQIDAVLKWLAMNKDNVVNKEIDMMSFATLAAPAK